MKRIRGFTLLELMVTVAIMGIIASFALPNFSQMVQNNRLDKVREDLFSDLVLARSEALARNSPITICATADPNVSTPTCSNTNVWATGWLVFVDTDQDQVFDVADSDEFVSIYRNASPNISIDWRPFAAANHFVLFDRLGRMSAVNNGTFHFCNTSSGYAESIIISKIGRARFEAGATCS